MRWVIFDYGGVLCRPQSAHDLARLARVAGCEPPGLEAAYWSGRLAYDLADLDGESYWQKIGAAVGRSYSPDVIAELIRMDTESWLHPEPDMLALVEEIAVAGHGLALLSNAPCEVAAAVSALPVAARFHHLAFSCHLRAAKPGAAIYLDLLGRLGVPAAEAVFVDDRPENVAAAQALGVAGVAFRDPADTRRALVRHGIELG